MSTPAHTIVVGGGLVGAACAYYLQRAGSRVTIIEKSSFGSGCSYANCGYICPGHVLPLAEPGAIGRTMKAMCRSGSPFYIRPRLDPWLWAWLLRFAGRCNQRDMMEAGVARQALLASSMSLYEKLLEDEDIDCEWERRGLLYVYQTKAALDDYARTDALLREHFNEPATRLDRDALLALEPTLKPDLAGGWHYEHEAHLRSERLLSEWRRVLEAKGVVVHENCELRNIRKTGRNAHAIDTNLGEMTADAFVIATGATTPLLRHALGWRAPIQPGKGYSITMPRPANCPTTPMIFQEHKVAVTPMRSGYRLGSTMELGGYDTRINRKRLALLRRGAEPYLKEAWCEPVEQEWFGWRPMTYDGLPRIGALPHMDNVIVAVGHNMVGLSMATGTGALVAELLGAATPHVDPAPYSPRR
ncbi:MAG: D-amino-acid dehydrogenase [Rhodothermales bacterium]|jgi:D-amino-acid dehydrogenase